MFSELSIPTITALGIKLNFAHTNSDALSLSGKVALPAGFAAKGQNVALDVGGVMRLFTLDAKGHGKAENSLFSLKFKAKKGVVPAQTASFSVKLTHGAFAAPLSASGFVNDTVKSAHVAVLTTLLFNNAFLQTTRPGTYSAVRGKTGSSK